MKLALRELRRRPGRFVTATLILLLIALLLMFLGGLVDGLIGNSTGAVRAQKADGIVFASTARDSFLRSRIDPSLRSEIEATPGVEKTGGIGIVQTRGPHSRQRTTGPGRRRPVWRRTSTKGCARRPVPQEARTPTRSFGNRGSPTG